MFHPLPTSLELCVCVCAQVHVRVLCMSVSEFQQHGKGEAHKSLCLASGAYRGLVDRNPPCPLNDLRLWRSSRIAPLNVTARLCACLPASRRGQTTGLSCASLWKQDSIPRIRHVGGPDDEPRSAKGFPCPSSCPSQKQVYEIGVCTQPSLRWP